MAKKLSTATFVKDLEAALRRGDGYILASYGQNPRTGYLDLTVKDVKPAWKTTGWYYTQYSGSQRAQALKWREKCTRVWDCNGMAEGIYEIHTGESINTQARYNYANWCSKKGSGMIPAKYRVPGAAVFWGDSASNIHHVAYLWKPVVANKPSGDWYLIEARGVMYGVIKSNLLSRKPNYWGWMDRYFDYSADAPADDTESTHTLLGTRTLKNGSEGEDVKEMQLGLIRLGYDLGRWGADGDFGDCTEIAVKNFQSDNGLKPDGIFGPTTYEVFHKALVAHDKPTDTPRRVDIVGGNCYVREGPGKDYPDIGIAYNGDELPFGGVVDEDTRWIKVAYKDTYGWVSPKYGKLV